MRYLIPGFDLLPCMVQGIPASVLEEGRASDLCAATLLGFDGLCRRCLLLLIVCRCAPGGYSQQPKLPEHRTDVVRASLPSLPDNSI